MEFLDLSDANDDEKAEAMSIIGSAPVYGVEFPFELKGSTDLSDLRDSGDSMSQSMSAHEINQSMVDSRSMDSRDETPPTHRQKSSPTHEHTFIASHQTEQIPQTSLPQWEMSASNVGPVVCGPPQTFIYHQTSPHYYPTNGPMAGAFYSSIANGSPMSMSSNKEVNKMRSSGQHNSNKSGKGVHSPDIRAPFYPPHNQYSDVPQLIESNRQPPPPTMVSDAIMTLPNGPPVPPMFTPGFAPPFLAHPQPPFPQMYLIATPEGSYITYGLPTTGVQMPRPSSPPSVPNVITEDISAITSNVPSIDGNGSQTPVDEINSELNDEIVIESNDENENIVRNDNEIDNQNYRPDNELIIETNVDTFKVSDNNESIEVMNSSDIHFNDSNDIKTETETNSSMPSTHDNSVSTTQSSSVTPNDLSATVYTNSGQKSWASLFKEPLGASNHNSLITSSNHSSSALNSGPIVSQNFTNSLNLSESDSPLNSSVILNCESDRSAQIQCIPMCNDPLARKLAKKVKEMNLKHYLPYLIPYGLVNRGNWCYINATLQALVGCPPFYNLMREIGETSGLFRERSSTPIIDSFAKFFTKFNPSEHLTRKQRNGANVSTEDLPRGEPIEPRCIYDVLGAIKSECLKGRQEDAEEFLSSVLNGLHEEMIALFKLLSNDIQKKPLNGDHSKANGHFIREQHNGTGLQDIEENDINDEDDSNLWKEVTPRHKAMPTRSAKVVSTPIFDMFGGSTLSIRTAGKDVCGNRQPFFTLQLDIQSDKVKSVEDALKFLNTSESIQGYMCPKTKQAMDASAQTFLDTLPPILILHLKLFVYDMDGGCRKLMKRIEYPVDLELPRECLHYDKWDREKNLQLKRYKLLSVVYHDGAEAIKGHYVTDVYHIGSNQWLRCDDGSVKVIPIQKVLNTDTSRTPYLLFYRRFDTLYSKHTIPSNNSKQFSH